ADDSFFGEVDETARTLALDLRERVLAMPDPQPVTMFDHVYPNGSPELDQQRAQFAAYEASFEGSAH
ncbi:pyruvate dehydrogenase (acetyl-transferring) E1 component subunit alpha, partial [Actinoplanes sp. ATCC 53533]